MFGNIFTFILSLLLLPVCYGIGNNFFRLILKVNSFSGIESPWTYFICGAISYIFLQLIFFRPLRIYVFGHEFAHAIAGWLTGARVKTFKIKKSSGSVSLTKINIFIALAPYFIPIYSIVLILFYALFNICTKNVYNVNHYFQFLLGITISFHVALTVFAINQGQSDLEKYGVIYSLLLIFVSNCLILAAMFSVFFQVSFLEFLKDSVKDSWYAYLWACHLLIRAKENIWTKL
ncbi:MAG: M50 family metallopeptidase [Elusimicrobia bacterium]|nr:M50 family metallopeptidase [Elusimicrobiota bacterium]MBU2614717.1 M50 family metallopeptidase [Elusimicrobiota bacterium]